MATISANNVTSAKPVSDISGFPNDYFMFCFHGSEEFLLPFQIFFCFVNPTLSLLGITVNTLCLAILRKSGLSKPSNIFLFALAVADSMNMFNTINFPDILRLFGPVKTKRGYCTWEYDGHLNMFLAVMHCVFIVIGNCGQLINATIPVMITAERMLAVYFPVTFKKVVTFKSAFIACACVYTLWLPYGVFTIFLRRLAYFQLPDGNSVALMITTELMKTNYFLLYNFIAYGIETLGSWLPTSLVFTGCTLIWIRVKMSLYRRKELSVSKGKRKWSPRTTRTLLTTCIIFAVTHTFNSIISVTAPVDLTMPYVTFFLGHFSDFINILHCSSNFPVYVLCNRHLYQTFLQIIGQTQQK